MKIHPFLLPRLLIASVLLCCSVGAVQFVAAAKGENGAVDRILEAAQTALEERHDPDRYRFATDPRWIPRSLASEPASSVREVSLEGSVGRYTSFSVAYSSGGRNRTADIQLKVTMEKKLPVTSERVTSGTVISDDHLEYRWVEIGRWRGQLVSEADELPGKTLRRTLAMGEPVRRADITTEYLVEAGESVTLVFINSGTRIDLSATARQSGALNEDIRLYSEETRRTYLGTVSGNGEVIWKRTL